MSKVKLLEQRYKEEKLPSIPVGKLPVGKLENFKGKKGGLARPISTISVNDLVKRGHLLQREMSHSESQKGIPHRHSELHISCGKGHINSTRLIRDNTLSVRRLKGTRPLIPSRSISADLKQAIINFLETGNIDTDLSDWDRGQLYSFISAIEHFGSVSPEQFYTDRILGIIERGELAPLNSSLISELEELLSIVRKKKYVTKTTLRYLEERWKALKKNED